MIKIPATAEGLPAVEQVLSEGINVNITLMFSLDHYEAVAQAYLSALGRCEKPHNLASVASFFVSRVDTKIDGLLEEIGSEEALSLRGKIAIANSKMAYQRFRELFHGEAFAAWREQGVGVQRVLWASTSTKNPSYRDVIYVEELVGPETVNTVPPSTLEAFRDHGEARDSLTGGLDQAKEELQRLAALGIDLGTVTEELQREGIDKFAQPFDRLLETLEQKRSALEAAEPAG
jgi:transaldolase